MEWALQVVSRTPIWVWVLFIYLISIGVKALKPGEITLARLAIMPIVLAGWGGLELVRLYGISIGSVGPWLLALLIGAMIGWLIIRSRTIGVDRDRGVIRRPPDVTVLPLVLLIFAIKYAFGVIGATAPQLLLEDGVRLFDLGVSGLFTGIFVGKFLNYAARFYCTPASSSPLRPETGYSGQA